MSDLDAGSAREQPAALTGEGFGSAPRIQRLLESWRPHRPRRLTSRELRVEAVTAMTLLLVALAMAALLPSDRGLDVDVALVLVACHAVASRVRLYVGAGYAMPTQLVLVPMLFVLPLAYVPLCVVAAFLLRAPLAYWRSGARIDRLLLMLVFAWHTVGPVLVLGLALSPSGRTPNGEHWPLYLAALGAQFAFDLGSSGLRNWIGLSVSLRTSVRYLSWVYLVDCALATVGLLVALQSARHTLLVLLILPLVALLKLFSRERVERIDHASKLGQAYRGTAFLLGDVVEADDSYTGEHSRDVVNLTLAVCDRLDLSPRERRDAEFVALLHDVGKIRIPSEIINKPGPLTPEERTVIETHTVEGEEMLTRVGGLLGEIGNLVRSCHERWDGLGYPDGLVGEQIPLIARIVCCTDAFSAMTTDRPYRKARSVEEALTELRRCAGTHFDPQVVEAVAGAVGPAPGVR
jgi:HD-GYP domain-containing protein (c-di-GMP phosphodiesterase class II)